MKKMLFMLCAFAAVAALAAPQKYDARYDYLTKKFNMFNIIPCRIGAEEETVKDIIEFYQRTGIDTVLYSMPLHPQNSTPYKRLDDVLASYRKVKAGLAGYPIKFGALIQAILGHVTNPTVVIDGWTRTYTSRQKAARFCALNPNFAKYIRTVGARVAAEKPFFILGDDDIRSNNGGRECFCALHVAEYNRRFKGNFKTPEEYRSAVVNAKNTDQVYLNYEILRKEGVANVGKFLREGINSVDPSIPGGTCCPGGEYYHYFDLTREMAAKNQPHMMRMCNAHYVEESPRDFPYNVLKTQIYRKHFSSIPSLFDESDTFPQALHSKSAMSLHAKVSSAIFNGLRGTKLWYVNCHKPGDFVVSRKYTDILAKHAKFYPALFEAVQGSRDGGVFIPGFKSEHLFHSTNSSTPVIPPEVQNWAWFMGIYGIPFYGEVHFDKPGVYALRGAYAVGRLTDAQLKDMFKHKVLVDGAAAVELCKRGFSKYMGIETRTPDCFYRSEVYPDTGKSIYCRSWKDAPELVIKSKNAKVLTLINAISYAVKGDRNRVLPGAVLCENFLGGKVLTVAFCSEEHFSLRAGSPRQNWLNYLLDNLDPEVTQGAVMNDQPVMAVKRFAKDGSKLLMIVNLGYDPLDSVTLKLNKVAKIESLNEQGKWVPVKFKRACAKNVVADIAMPCYKVVILRVK